MNNRKRTVVYLSIMVLGAFLIQGCAIVRWHNRMMQAAMGSMGMGGHEDHDKEREGATLVSSALCQARVYLNHSDELGLTSDQIEELRKLELSCQKELVAKEAEIKTTGLDYQTSLDNLANNKVERSMVEAKAKEIAAIYARMLLIPLGYQEKAAAILTASQKERLRSVSPSEHKAGYRGH